MVRHRMAGRLSDRRPVKMELRQARLSTVCEEARCPNIGECFGAGTATFLILGDVCTRRCGFCSVRKKADSARLLPPDPEEPNRLAATVQRLGLSHAVITSVTRDDLPDGGAGAFVACIQALRSLCPQTSIEVLVPDFSGRQESVDRVLDCAPQVFNHNIETVPRLYSAVRPGADFVRSLRILSSAARRKDMKVKSGLMVGLGEEDGEVLQVLERLVGAGCGIVTIGQYLQPTRQSLPVQRQVSEEGFRRFHEAGARIGLSMQAGPLVRSSYRAWEVLREG